MLPFGAAFEELEAAVAEDNLHVTASIGAQLNARRLKMIATVFVTIAILPLVPGLGLYRAMSAFAQGQTALGASTLAHAMALVVMIALGIGFGAALRRPGKREARFRG